MTSLKELLFPAVCLCCWSAGRRTDSGVSHSVSQCELISQGRVDEKKRKLAGVQTRDCWILVNTSTSNIRARWHCGSPGVPLSRETILFICIKLSSLTRVTSSRLVCLMSTRKKTGFNLQTCSSFLEIHERSQMQQVFQTFSPRSSWWITRHSQTWWGI